MERKYSEEFCADVIQAKERLTWPQVAAEMPKKWSGYFVGLNDLQRVSVCRVAYDTGKRSAGRKPFVQPYEMPAEQSVQPLTAAPIRATPALNVQEALMVALAKGTTSQALAESLGLSEKMALAMIEEKKDAGYNVREVGGVWRITKDLIPTENHIKDQWNGNRIVRFGLMGDTQINSKYTQLTHLHKTYDFFESEGIETVYHTGDIDEGEQMRKGHQYECYNQGVDDHAAEIVKVYPRRNGMRTRFICGNHDYSMVKLAGVDIGRKIAAERDDMEYLGQDSAVIGLTDNCNMELRHPGDGTAYALSYKLQKMIEAMSGGEKPNLLAVGHYHKQEYIFYRNVHALQTGCFQAQTPWERGKGISVAMGGWIIELRLNVDGGIERIIPEFFPFYTAIKDDWKNWR
jgi:UDP-2,3-diacylglucosamine pyrophosphatase LpxH/biotin operon repressor